MRARNWEVVSIFVIVIGGSTFSASLVLPSVKAAQGFVVEGPALPYGNSNYTISGYFVPPVDEGNPIRVSIYAYKPNSILLTVVPLQGDLELQPILATSVTTPERYSANLTSSMSAPYRILITSLERTTYILTVDSVWSQFYALGTYKAPALFVVLIGLVGTLYFRYRGSREDIEENVRTELRERSSESAEPSRENEGGPARTLSRRAEERRSELVASRV